MRGQLNPRLLALLVGGVGATIAGVQVIAYVVGPSVTRADLLDAGVVIETNPKRLSCWVCGELCGGGCCQKSIFGAVAKNLLPDGGRQVIFPRSAIALRAYVDQFDERNACRVSTLTWGEVQNFGADPAGETPPCSCRARADAGTCRLTDGGLPAFATTYQPGETTGACASTLCGGPAGSEPLSEACR